jgi:hypothetical protein
MEKLNLRYIARSYDNINKNKGNHTETLNSVALVRKQTIPTERPPNVGEFSAKFCG